CLGSWRRRSRHAFLHDVPDDHFTFGGWPLVEFRIHPAYDPFTFKRGLVLLADGGILPVIRDRTPTLAQIDRAVVHELFTRTAGLASACIVRAKPGREAKRVGRDAEMLVEPVAAHRRSRYHADRLIVLTEHLVGAAVLPGCHGERIRPGIGVALAFDADEHGRRSVLVRLGIAAALVLADPQIEAVAGHRRLDAAVAGRAPVVERQVGVDD